MNLLQEKAKRNIAGLEFLLSRSDTRDMLPQSGELDKQEFLPAFYMCHAIMRDNLSVICISLRVSIKTFLADGNEQYTHRDIHGRGTTFEMALFDLSAQLITVIGMDDIVDTESLPLVEERNFHEQGKGPAEDTGAGVRANDSGAIEHTVTSSERNVESGMAARSDNSGGSGADACGNSERGGKSAGRSRGRGRIKRSCR